MLLTFMDLPLCSKSNLIYLGQKVIVERKHYLLRCFNVSSFAMASKRVALTFSERINI